MFYRIKWFFKAHVQKGTWIWESLLVIQHLLQKLERLKWHIVSWTLPFGKIQNLNRYECKIYSQHGEDGMLSAIFRKIGVTNKFGVEFGVENGLECNTRYLIERQGWTCLRMDPADNNPPSIQHEFITADNINEVFKKYAVPPSFDLLSIDIDGNDYWVWKALDATYTPRVVVVEYNATIPPAESKTIVYETAFKWDGSNYFGASLGAFIKLAKSKGYTLVGCDRIGVNAFFIRNDVLTGHFVPQSIEKLYRPPRYGKKEHSGGWPPSSRKMVEV